MQPLYRQKFVTACGPPCPSDPLHIIWREIDWAQCGVSWRTMALATLPRLGGPHPSNARYISRERTQGAAAMHSILEAKERKILTLLCRSQLSFHIPWACSKLHLRG